MQLVIGVEQFFVNKKVSQIYVALSGGVDSSVLLDLLVRCFHKDNITAIHINHGLSQYATQWQEHCRNICANYGVKFYAHQLKLQPTLSNLESQARQARYQIFAQYIKNAEDYLVTAHHLDDQAETFLLRLMRGAGVQGLTGISPVIKFASGMMARPLLTYSKQQLMDYAAARSLTWVEDESNVEIKFSRNFVRHEVLPTLEQHWPAAKVSIVQSAAHCAEATELLDELARLDYAEVAEELKIPPPPKAVTPFFKVSAFSQFTKECDFTYVEKASDLAHFEKGGRPVWPGGFYAKMLNLTKLSQLSHPRIKNLIRFWLSQQGMTLPSRKKQEQIISSVINARPDSHAAVVAWDQYEIRKYQGYLYALTPQKLDRETCSKFEAKYRLGERLYIPPLQQYLYIKPHSLPDLQNQELTVRFRRTGDKLKKKLQALAVPPWQRDRILLILFENKIVKILY